MQSLSTIMKAIRRKRKLKANELASAMSMSPAYLSCIEKGTRPVPRDFFAKLHSLLNLTNKERESLNKAKIMPINGLLSLDAMKKDMIKDINILFIKLRLGEPVHSIIRKIISDLCKIRSHYAKKEQPQCSKT